MEDAVLADALGAHLRGVAFVDLDTDEVTSLLIDAIEAWALAQGWRAYRRAASVVPLPPPYSQQHSVVDIGIARPGRPPVVVEVDHADRRRTVEKLVAEAAAGRLAVWVRRGAGKLNPPPAPVLLVAVPVESRRGPSGAKVHTSETAARRAPEHSAAPAAFEPLSLTDDSG
jgi:hypothetical protein